MADGLIIAAPSSGSGKTVATLAMLRALKRQGVSIVSAKIGPDYIDPRFHEAATNAPCINLDPWAMRASFIASSLSQTKADKLIIEGVMGLYDGAENDQGSTADLAIKSSLPVLFVVDASRQAQSIAALVQGFVNYRKDVNVAGVLLNRVGSPRHEEVLRKALSFIPVYGAIPRLDHLELPGRHLGLVQAEEIESLESFLNAAADTIIKHVDLHNLPFANISQAPAVKSLAPLGQRMAIARDAAFGFLYPHLLQGFREQGAEIEFFSPLADEKAPKADCIFLPGGYPELHAEKLSANQNFLESLRQADSLIYGECGGFMCLGEGLIDANGNHHKMAGLLPVTTNFAKRKLQLGYRQLHHDGFLPWPQKLRGHEFHYSTLEMQASGENLFTAQNSQGEGLAPMGLRSGKVMGSYAHVIDEATS